MKKKLLKGRWNSRTLIGVVIAVVLLGTAVKLASQAAVVLVPGDVNFDEAVDVFDLSILLANWEKTTPATDVNGDGTTNVFDLSILLSHWGQVPTVEPSVSDEPTPTDLPTATPIATTGCTIAASATLQDNEFPADIVYTRPAGQKLAIYLVDMGIDTKYLTALQAAAAKWNASPCLNLIVTDTCPTATAFCVDVAMIEPDPTPTETPLPGDPPFEPGDPEINGVDGSGISDDAGTSLTGGFIGIYPAVVDTLGVNGTNAALVHAIGHALGLNHRVTSTTDVMKAKLLSSTSPTPDAVDFKNILVLYGTKI